MSYWVIVHGDKLCGTYYWTGYDRALRDHRFSRDASQAIRFCRKVDAVKAGVKLTQGSEVREIEGDSNGRP